MKEGWWEERREEGQKGVRERGKKGKREGMIHEGRCSQKSEDRRGRRRSNCNRVVKRKKGGGRKAERREEGQKRKGKMETGEKRG